MSDLANSFVSRRTFLAATGATAAAVAVGLPAGQAGAATTDPVVHANRTVTFTLRAPSASSVSVTGSWGKSFTGGSYDLVRGSGGVWSVTTGPFVPTFYTYSFVVDGVPLKDPANDSVVHSSPALSTFLVPGPGAELITQHAVPHGRVGILDYYSRVTGTQRHAAVWTPPGYSTAGGRYPTFYLYHGGGGDYLDWVQQGRANVILDNLYAAGKIEPMVVVMGDGNIDGSLGLPEDDKFPAELLDNLVPAVEKAYSVSHSPHQRALAGLSLGGLQVWNTLLTHPGEFDFIGDFSSGYFPAVIDALSTTDSHLLRNRKINRKTDLHVIYIGNTDDIAYQNNVATRALFDSFGIDYVFAGSYAQAGHTWETWRHNLPDFAQRLHF